MRDRRITEMIQDLRKGDKLIVSELSRLARSMREAHNIVHDVAKRKGFDFTLEYRKHYRKEVKLPGEYVVQKSGEKGEAIIRELSLSGIQFECMRPHRISTDDILDVKFKLDNSLRSEIRRFAKVIWVKNCNVGAKFAETQFYEKDLGFYMQK